MVFVNFPVADVNRSVAFYEKLGFETFGEVEDDAGAPHIWMLKKLK